MKKLVSIVLALAMVLLCVGAAMATNSYSITIDNAKKGETYTAYKIFDVTYSGTNSNPGTVPDAPAADNTHQHTSYSYSIVEGSEWWSVVTSNGTTDSNGVISANGLTFTPTTTQVSGHTVYTVGNSSLNASTFAALLNNNKASKTPAGTATPNADGSITIDVNPDVPGYYFVDTSLGSLCSLDTAEPSATIREKNSVPSEDKKQAIDSAPTAATGYTDNELNVQVGDTVWYQIEVTDGKGTDANIVITDALSTGLTFDTTTNPALYVSINGGAEAALTNGDDEEHTYYTVTNKTASGFTVTLLASYVQTLTEVDKVYIRFAATVNNSAVVALENNTSTITYSNQSAQDTVYVAPWKFKLEKTDGSQALKGAKFELYRGSVADANKISFLAGTAESEVPVLNVVTSGTANSFTVINLSDAGDNHLDAASVIFKGLDKDTYVLREIEAPAGYNRADDTTVADTTMVKVDADITAAATVTVVNHAGTELPSTGGIGTTIFYIVGGLLLVGAAVILVARRKAHD